MRTSGMRKSLLRWPNGPELGNRMSRLPGEGRNNSGPRRAKELAERSGGKVPARGDGTPGFMLLSAVLQKSERPKRRERSEKG